MKILFIIPELGYGGAESALLRLAGQLSMRHSVTIAVFCRYYQSGNYATAALTTSLPVVELDCSGSSVPNWFPPRLGRWLRRARELRSLKRQCDVAISFLGGANLLNVLVRAGKPCVLSERGSKRHDPSGTRFSLWLWNSLLNPLVYRCADRIVCVSQSLSNEIRKALPCKQHYKVITIAGYLDPCHALAARRVPIDSQLLPLADRPLLVSAGRLHPVKGFQHLLPLFAQVTERVPNSGLLIVGDGPQRDELVRLASVLGLRVCINNEGEILDPKAQVIFLGYRSQPARYMRLGHAFVMPSVWEGLPNILLEALAAGAWSLATDCGGSAEILSTSELGRLLPPIERSSSKEQWLAALVEALLHSPPRQLSLPCRQQLVARFSIQRSAQHWEALLEELIG